MKKSNVCFKCELTVDEVREYEMCILDEIHSVCKQENLTYWLSFGSLIGAVRHQGFIPWDDDIDICLTRNDFESLREYYETHSTKYSLLDESEYIMYDMFKIVDKSIVVKCGETEDRNQYLWIDVFPYDALPNTQFKRLIKLRFVYALDLCQRAIVSARTMNHKPKGSIVRQTCIYFSRFLLKRVPICFTRWMKSKYKQIRRRSVDKCTKYISTYFFNNDIFERHWVDQIQEVKFEDRRYSIPTGYDYMLKKRYGNYMQLPPKDERMTSHAISAFRCESMKYEE